MELMDDGLPISDVGEWVHDKHLRLTRYIEISKHVRQKFSGPGKSGATFIDLYCGPGRCRVRSTGELLDGSAIVAGIAAQNGSITPFSEIYVGDLEGEAVRATAKRLAGRGVMARTHEFVGPAHETAQRVATRLSPYGLHLIFLDPYNLGDLPIEVIKPFGSLHHADLLIHVSAMDLQRNLEQAIDAKEGHQFDRFAPGWRAVVNMGDPSRDVRRQIRSHWIGLVKKMGFHVFEGQFTPIRGSKNQLLYWLAFAAKHDKASEFWDKIRKTEPQKGFDF